MAALRPFWDVGQLLNIAARVWREMNKDDIFNRAAILGFYFMLALFPLLLCLTALLGLFAQTGTEMRDQMFSFLARVAPRSTRPRPTACAGVSSSYPHT